jgi:hypothetical protein
MLSNNYKRMTLVNSIILFAMCFSICSAESAVRKDQRQLNSMKRISTVQVPFIANKGQLQDSSIQFYAHTFGGIVSVSRDGQLKYLLLNEQGPACIISEKAAGGLTCAMQGGTQSPTMVSIYKGKNPSNWQKNIKTYSSLDVGEIYKGVNLELKAYGNTVEKIFQISAGTQPEIIRMTIEGLRKLRVNGSGELELITEGGTVTFTKPVAYQKTADGRRSVAVSYDVKGNTYSFKTGSYDRSRELIIDPLLASTFIGGSDDTSRPRSMALDSSGNVYITGYTRATDFPTTSGSFSTALGGSYDAFIAKFDPDLKTLLAATYYGGADSGDEANSIRLDSSNNVYITGETGSWELPTTLDAFQPEHKFGKVGSDAFVAKFDSSLQNLLAATYLSGSNGGAEDVAYCLAIGPGGSVYVAGKTDAPDFPVVGGYRVKHPADSDNPFGGTFQAFIVKLDANLKTMLAGTFFGADELDTQERILSMITDTNENLYVTGETESANFPTTAGAYDKTINDGTVGPQDVFIAKFDSSLVNLLACTFLGGSDSDSLGYDYPQKTDKTIALDSSGNVYVTGKTSSEKDFPTTPGAFSTTREYGGTFVSKFDNKLEKLLASTFLCNGSSRSIAIDRDDNVCIAGDSEYECPTSSNAYQKPVDEYDSAYIIKLNKDLTTMRAATFLGGSDTDTALSIAVDNSNNIYITGWTESSDFPTSEGAYDRSLNSSEGDESAFVAKLDKDLSSGASTTTSVNVECPLKLSLPHTSLTPFYELRELLNKSPQGQHLVTTYYQHAQEISRILRAYPELQQKTGEFLSSSIAFINAYCKGASAAISGDQIKGAQAIMQEVARHGSAGLQQDLKQIMDALKAGKIFQIMGGVKSTK